MNKVKEIFNLLSIKIEQPFEITRPSCKGLYRLTDNLYIQRYSSDNKWESSQFQLCDLLNGTIDIKPIGI